MSFDGHDLYIINNNWSFDLTTFTGYRTWKNRKGQITAIKEAFKIIDRDRDGKFNYNRLIEPIPMGILRKSEDIINNYYSKALVNIEDDRDDSEGTTN